MIRTSQVGQRRKSYGRESLNRNSPHNKPSSLSDAHDSSASRLRSRVDKSFLVNKLTIILIAVALVIAFAVAGWYMYSSNNSSPAAMLFDDQRYQAVFLAGGQVYFGKLELVNNQYLKLSNVFYIQPDSSSAEGQAASSGTSDSESSMQLIKLGDEVHGPDDSMTINRDQVLFFEDLKSDGKVAQLIDKYRQGN